jgi:hypothetical protein
MAGRFVGIVLRLLGRRRRLMGGFLGGFEVNASGVQLLSDGFDLSNSAAASEADCCECSEAIFALFRALVRTWTWFMACWAACCAALAERLACCSCWISPGRSKETEQLKNLEKHLALTF